LSENIEVLLKIGDSFYEGKLHRQAGSQVSNLKRPLLPEPYGEMVSVSEEGSFWVLKPRQFLQTTDFSEILRLVKAYPGGEYVSAGKSSHFRVPK
jgi:hypothetical protein